MVLIKYLTPQVLKGFDDYKYSSVDNSPVGKYITHPFWNWVVQFCPMSVAPNTLTFSGFMLLVLQFLLLSFYDYRFYASDDTHPEVPPVPRWLWLVSFLCMFFAHTLDGIDGKQARRTKTSGPLGELFDHGIDSWATFYMPVCLYSLFGRSYPSVGPNIFYVVMLMVMVTFIITHWEKYNTGVLYLPWGYDPSQLFMALAYLVAFVFDYTVFKLQIPVLDWSIAHVFLAVMVFAVLFVSLPTSVWNVYVSYRDGTSKQSGLYECIRPVIPAVILWSLFIAWGCYSSYDIIKNDPRLFYYACGVVFSNITCRLIVSGMSHSRCQIFNLLLIPLIAIVLAVMTSNLGKMELYLLWAYSIFATAVHVHYAICVVQDIADHLNIYVFSVMKPPKKLK